MDFINSNDKFSYSIHSNLLEDCLNLENLNINDNQINNIKQLHDKCSKLVNELDNKSIKNDNTVLDNYELLLDENEMRNFFKKPFFESNFKNNTDKSHYSNDSPFIWFNLHEEEIKYSIKVLNEELKEKLFFKSPIKWLLSLKLIDETKCHECNLVISSYKKINDEFFWECERCKIFKVFKTHNIISFCNKYLNELPNIIYNWSVFGNLGFCKNQSTVPSNILHSVFDLLQSICEKTNNYYIRKLGNNGKKVELFTQSINGLFIVFAYEEETKFFKFKVFDGEDFNFLKKEFKNWFEPKIVLTTYEDRFKILENFGFKVYKIKRNNFDTSKNYFSLNLFGLLFKNINHEVLTAKGFYLFLHEVLWRSLFAETPYSAFNAIVTFLINQTDEEYIKYLNNLVTKVESTYYIDEIYYGKYISSLELNETSCELRNDVICHFCYTPCNFLNLHSHLSVHLKRIKRRKMRPPCDHCNEKFNNNESMTHKDLMKGKSILNSCKICCTNFSQQLTYINHLKRYHKPQDHPYSCKYCPFRTSFYHELIKHFQITHSDFAKAYCNICLKVFEQENTSELFFKHLEDHYFVKDTYRCTHCVLIFVNKESLDMHFLKDHIEQKKNYPNFFVSKFKFINDSDKLSSFRVNLKDSKKKRSKKVIKLNDGKKVKIVEKKCKRNHVNLGYEETIFDKTQKKNFILNKNQFMTCLECSQPMDLNHLSKKLLNCNKCGYQCHCPKSISYPCNLHFSNLVDTTKYKT